MGITIGVKGYHLLCLSSKKIISSRDVTFHEFSILKKVTAYSEELDNTSNQSEGIQQQVEGTSQ